MKFTWTERLTIITPLVMLISIMTAGGGHGTPLPTLLCYPGLFLFDIHDSGGGPLVWTILLGQFPMYGFLIDLGKFGARHYLTTGLVVIIHLALVLIVMRDQEF
jgi:hypothetical protein